MVRPGYCLGSVLCVSFSALKDISGRQDIWSVKRLCYLSPEVLFSDQIGEERWRELASQVHLEYGGSYASSHSIIIIWLFCWQGHLNSSQMSSVSCITNAVLQPYASSKICLLQGPPGTGKSLTAVALIENILAQVTCMMYFVALRKWMYA